jgi:hypothetical protein
MVLPIEPHNTIKDLISKIKRYIDFESLKLLVEMLCRCQSNTGKIPEKSPSKSTYALNP